MADAFYRLGKVDLLDGDRDLLTGTIQVMLVDSGYTFDASHDNPDDGPAANELSGTGYARKTLASKTVTEDATYGAVFDAADLTWTGINAGTADAAIIFIFVSDDTDSILLAYIDSGGFPAATNGGDLTITWHTTGIFYW